MMVEFTWTHVTPARPHGDLVEAVYSSKSRCVVSATYVSSGRPLPSRSLRLLDASVGDCLGTRWGRKMFRRALMRFNC